MKTNGFFICLFKLTIVFISCILVTVLGDVFMEENSNYVITKSAWKAFTLWRVLLIWTIIPIFIILIHIWILKSEKTYFYEDRIISKSGILSKHVKETSFVGVSAICVDQTLGGRIFNFGDLHIDVVGRWKVTIKGVKKPIEAREFLVDYLVRKGEVTSVMEA